MQDSSEIVTIIDPASLVTEAGSLSPAEEAVLARINQKISAGNSLTEILNFFFEESRPIFPCDRTSLVFLEEGGNALASYWARADYAPLYLKAGYREALTQGSLRTLLEEGRLRIISDLEKYAAMHPHSNSSRLLVREGVRSNMTCPLYVEQRIVGLFFRSSRKAHAYDRHQACLHSQLAERLAQAVEKSWRIEQLQLANRAYLEMLAFASHELRSPLASLRMDADLLLHDFAGPLAEGQRERVASMLRRVDILLERTRDYLDLAKFESGESHIQALAQVRLLEDLINPVLELLASQLRSRRMAVTTAIAEQARVLTCDPAAIKTVLINLIGNAVKYGEDGGTISIKAESAPGLKKVAIWNSGAGFPEDQRHRLFQRFSRLPRHKNISGSGVGLYMAAQIMRQHGGRIYAHSEQGKWAEFTFELPG